jgi:hypothetical protein
MNSTVFAEPTTDAVPASIAIDYVVDGDRTAAAVASGTSQLQAIVIVLPDGKVQIARHPTDSSLQLLNTPHRVYCDAVFGRTVEAKFGLTAPATFDDVRAMLMLLGESDPNFGIVYGQTEHGLARKLGISVAEARGFIDSFFLGRPAVRDWIEIVKQQVRRSGYVKTLSRRRRNLPAIWSGNSAAIAEAERQAVNTIIQGTAADLLKLMLARLYRSLPDDFRLLLTVHDSILLEVPDNRVDEARDLVRQDMESPILGFSIPIQVEIQCGATWAGMDELETTAA